MKVGDLVRFIHTNYNASSVIGIILKINPGFEARDHSLGILWGFISDVGWQRLSDVEVINEDGK